MSDTRHDHDAHDELAVRSLIARIALLGDAADANELDEFLGCFTEDTEWQAPGASGQGHASLRAGMQSGAEGRGSDTRHVITTQSVKFEGPDTAISDCCFLFYGDVSSAPAIRLIGVYHDTVRRTDEGWKLARREVSFG